MFEVFKTKFYHSGFVYLNSAKYWMELCGPMLSLWKVPDLVAEFPFHLDSFADSELNPHIDLIYCIKSAAPMLVNVSDSTAELFDVFSGATPIPYTSFFALYASDKLYIFACATDFQANYWVGAFRLVSFELYKLNLQFTKTFIHHPMSAICWTKFNVPVGKSANCRESINFEGPINVKVEFSDTWKNYYVVGSSRHISMDEFASTEIIGKLIFGQKPQETQDFSKRGSLLFYHSKSDVKKKAPLFILEQATRAVCLWPDTKHDQDAFSQISVCKIHGKLVSSSTGEVNTHITRSFKNFENGIDPVTSSSEIQNLISGNDARPAPESILLHSKNPQDLANWLVAIVSAFSLDSDLRKDEEELDYISKKGPTPWPTVLYMELAEIGGISMYGSQQDSDVFFQSYLRQKFAFYNSSKIQNWSSFIRQAEKERKQAEVKQLITKLNFLREWISKARTELMAREFEISTAPLSELVDEIISTFPTFKQYFVQLFTNITAKKKMEIDFYDSEGRGSVSECSSDARNDHVRGVADSETHQEEGSFDGNEIYGQNSLVKQLAIDGPKSAIIKQPEGAALINAIQSKNSTATLKLSGEDNLEDSIFVPNTLLVKAAAQKQELKLGPLLGQVEPDKDKPKLDEGLLGLMGRKSHGDVYPGLYNGNLADADPEILRDRAMYRERGEMHVLDVCEHLFEALHRNQLSRDQNQHISEILLGVIRQVNNVSVDSNMLPNERLSYRDTAVQNIYQTRYSIESASSSISKSSLSLRDTDGSSYESDQSRSTEDEPLISKASEGSVSSSEESTSEVSDEDVPLRQFIQAPQLQSGSDDSDVSEEPLGMRLSKTDTKTSRMNFNQSGEQLEEIGSSEQGSVSEESLIDC